MRETADHFVARRVLANGARSHPPPTTSMRGVQTRCAARAVGVT
jgi:hypothetical protein